MLRLNRSERSSYQSLFTRCRTCTVWSDKSLLFAVWVWRFCFDKDKGGNGRGKMMYTPFLTSYIPLLKLALLSSFQMNHSKAAALHLSLLHVEFPPLSWIFHTLNGSLIWSDSGSPVSVSDHVWKPRLGHNFCLQHTHSYTHVILQFYCYY